VVQERIEVVESGAVPEVTSTVTTNFSKRSLVKSVESDRGGVIAKVVHDADRLPLEIMYADAANTATVMTYTPRRQLKTVETNRGPPSLWTAPQSPPSTYVPPPASAGPSTLQLELENLSYVYDEVDNPKEIDDGRLASEWPAGAQPVSRTIQYDDLYRLTQIDYKYAAGSDTWTSPFAAEDQGISPDPQRATPSPHQSFASRVNQQRFAYDWLGNTTSTNDDANGFYDRSLGTITNGAPAAGRVATAGPYQIQAAGLATVTFGDDGSGTVAFLGNLTVAYDAAGNMTSVAVTRSGGGACLPAGAVCSQRFAYAWDEVGRLARARRWDVAAPGAATSPLPTSGPAADLRYTYDATDDRAIKQAMDGAGNQRYTLYPLDPLELRLTTWNTAVGDYDRTPETEVPYLFAHGVRLGRIELPEVSDPTLVSGAAHLFLELPDHLGSTAIVIDRDTS
jgi:hypothetical protein